MHNSASFTLDLVMAECWTTGVKAGIDAATIVNVFNEAALGQMMSLKVRLPATYLRGNFDPRFSLALARKDLGLALELARATDTPMRLAALCEQEMNEAIAAAGRIETPRSSSPFRRNAPRFRSAYRPPRARVPTRSKIGANLPVR